VRLSVITASGCLPGDPLLSSSEFGDCPAGINAPARELTEREIELADRGVEDLPGAARRGAKLGPPAAGSPLRLAVPVASSSPIVGSAMVMIVTRDNRTLHTPASCIQFVCLASDSG
jgi:hypothetical protein